MQINKNKSIGRVLFIVEGGKNEFSLLKRIFCNVLEYEYIEKRRNEPDFFKSKKISTSKVAVINTEESNIATICDEKRYLEELFELLISQYDFRVDQSAIYYLFDRDPKSNCNEELIKKLILDFANPYDNENGLRGGLLLLSYPSIESYCISNFVDDSYLIEEISIGEDAKAYVARNNQIQLNKISEETIEKASDEMMKYLQAEGIDFDIDNFSTANMVIFEKQENNYSLKSKYRILSLLSMAFIQLGIIELDE